MKILIVGPIAGGSLPIAKAISKAFVNLGSDAVFLDYSVCADEFLKVKASGDPDRITRFLGRLDEVLLEQVVAASPDVLLGIAQSPLYNPNLLDFARKRGVLTAFWFVEDFRVLTYWRNTAPLFDIYFSIQAENFKEALKQIGADNHYYLPLAFDGDFNEQTVTGLTPSEVSFMGAPYPNRVEILGKLALPGLKIYGEGWSRFHIENVAIGNRWISEAEARWIYRNSGVNLNLHSSMDQNGLCGDFVNPRTFELAGLGCFQLTDRRELLPDLYQEREIVQFQNEAEFAEMIGYFLEHEAERREIAINARRRTLRNHLYEHRAVRMMEAFQSF